jgi:toxin FitB
MQLVDTNIISVLVWPAPNVGVMQWQKNRQALEPTLRISAITLDELVYGVLRKPSPRLMNWLDAFEQTHDILPVTKTIARRAGELHAQLESKGFKRSQPDMFIAATAQIHGLTLVTRNLIDFDGCGLECPLPRWARFPLGFGAIGRPAELAGGLGQ